MYLLTNNIKFLILTLLITTIGYSQNLVPGGVDAGADFTLDCTSGPCTTLSADFHHSHETNSRYTVNSVPFDPVVVTLPSSISADDDYSNAIDLGFTFCFFGDFYDQIVIGDNGLLSFNVGLYAGDTNAQWQIDSQAWNIPSPSLPQDAVFGAFHDLYIVEGGEITYGVTGSAPFRAFVINYKSVAQYSSAFGCNDPTTQQIVLHETSNFIDVYLTEKPACAPPTSNPGWQNGRAAVGIQKGAGEEGYFAPGRNTSDSPWTASNEAWRFAPEETGGETFTFEWVNNGTGLVESTNPDFEVCPRATTTYTSNVTWIDCTGNTVSASDEVTITVDLPFTMEILGGDQDFCLGDPDYTINSTTTVLGSVTITGYNWYEISAPATSLGTTDSLTVNTTGTYVLEVTDSGGCVLSEQVIINYNPVPDAGTDGNIAFCSTDLTTDLFTSIGGAPDTGGVWSPALTSGSGVFNPAIDAGGIYTYTVAASGSCTDATATVNVILDIAPNAGADNTKAYCSIDAVSDLFLELGGTPDTGGIWSPALISGTGVFDPAIDVVGVYTYTVLATGLCIDASATITVSVDIAPEAGTNGSINYCSTDAPTDLFLELGGTPDIGGVWSPALTSGTGIFDPAVDTANTYTYIVTGGGCPDATSEVVVSIDTSPNAGTDATADFCTDNAIADLFNSLGGTPDTGGIWSPALTSGTGIFDPAVDVGGIYTYTVSSVGACLVDENSTVNVTLNTAPEAGTNGTMTFCSTDIATDLFLNLGGTPDMGGIWSPALTSGTGVFDPAIDAAGTYTYTVSGLGVCTDNTSEVVVTIDTAPDAGTNGTADFCTDNASTDLFDSLGGTPDTGGVWSPALTSGTGDFDPAVDIGGIYTYTVSPVGACFVAATATITVTVDIAPEAGIDGTMAFCSTDLVTDLFANLGGTADMGGTWSPVLTSGTGMFDPAVDVAGIYIYTVAGVGVCADNSAIVTVTVDLAPNAGLDGVTEFCTSDVTIDLITFLGGTPDTTGIWSPALTSGTGVFDPLVDITGIYTYTVSNGVCADAIATVNVTVYTAANAGTDDAITLCSNSPTVDLFTLLGGAPDLGGTWSPGLTSGTGFFDPAIDVAGIYTYTIIGTGVCADDTAAITVSIDAEPNAGTDITIEFCSTDATLDLFIILGGTPDIIGVWSPTLNSGTGVFDPATDTEGIYTYTVSNGVCADATAEVDVTLYQAPNAGANGTAEFCTSDLGDDLFKYLGGTPDATGTWSPALTSGTGMFDPAVDMGGTYTYTVLGNGTCTDVFTTVEVTVDTAPDAGLDADVFFCMSEPTVDLFSLLGGTPNGGGTWSPSMTSATGIFDPAADASGDYTYTVLGLGACADISSVISVALSEAPKITNVNISDFSENNTITVEVEGSVSGTSFGIGDYEYSLDGVSFQSENIIEGIAPGNYVLTVRDAKGCFPPAFKNISIVGAGKYFTPNNDGYNDTWNIINLTQEVLANPSDGVSIFDRFGKMIATLNASSIVGWDGNYNGNPLPSGDYWFSVLVLDNAGNPVLKRGHFSLIRR